MATRYQYFDSVDGDRIYSSEHFARHLMTLANDGYVFDIGDELIVTESSPNDLTVDVNTGICWIQGRLFQVYSSVETLEISTPDPNNPRIDRVIVRLDTDNRLIELDVLEGTPAPVPSPPNLTRTGGTYENSLAQVLIETDTTVITNDNITDERNDVDAFGGVAQHQGAEEIDSRINTRIDDLIIVHNRPATARVARGSLTIPSGGLSTLSWTNVTYDTDNMVDLASNDDLLTINTEGDYLLIMRWGYNFSVALPAEQASAEVRFLKNGDTIARDRIYANGYLAYRQSMAIEHFEIGDFIQIQVGNSSGPGDLWSPVQFTVLNTYGQGVISG